MSMQRCHYCGEDLVHVGEPCGRGDGPHRFKDPEMVQLEAKYTQAQRQIADLTAKLAVTNKQWSDTLAAVNASWEDKIKLRLAQLARYQAALAPNGESGRSIQDYLDDLLAKKYGTISECAEDIVTDIRRAAGGNGWIEVV